jgi:hypothetical protein
MTNIIEIKKILDSTFPQTDSEHLIVGKENILCINGNCLMPIILPVHYNKSDSITITTEDGVKMGDIIFMDKSLPIDINSLTEINFYCFLSENDMETIQESTYKFKYDYAIIESSSLNDYIHNYKTKSPLWGGFFHIDDLQNNHFSKTIKINEIEALKNVSIDNDYLKEILEQIVKESNPFNRFLKLYHLLEMQFDMHTAYQINSLLKEGGKEKEISETLRDYVRDDIERLKSLFKTKIDKNKLEPFLTNLVSHKITATKIFYYKEKGSNPLKSKLKFEQLLSNTIINQVSFDRTFGNGWFNDKINSVIAYWIYRVRSCIAHNKLGEYVMTKDDEDFVVEFAEPLIREAVILCYKNT